MTTSPRVFRSYRDWRLVRRLLGLPQALWCALAHRPLHKLREVQHMCRSPGSARRRVEEWRCRVCGRAFTRVRRLGASPPSPSEGM